MNIKGLPIFEGYPHTTSVLRSNGIERVIDYDGLNTPDLTWANEFIRGCDGVYLKWLNTYGGYSYWLFDHVYTGGIRVSSLGTIQNCWTNRQTATSSEHDLGRDSTPSLNISSKIKYFYALEVLTIVESPEVYLYTNKGSSTRFNAKYCGWIKVGPRESNYSIGSTKYNSVKLRLTLELPKRYTQKL